MNESKIIELVKKAMPESNVEVIDVHKNNGVTQRGMVIRESDTNIAPTIYFEKLEGSDEDIADQVLAIYKSSKLERLDIDAILDDYQDRVTARILNKKTDVTDLPHIDFGEDFVEIFAIKLDMGNNTGSIKVTYNLAERWGVNELDLHKLAMKNMKPTLSSMFDVLQEINLLRETDEAPDFPMYVLSNESKTYGASTVLNEKIMDRVGRIIGDFAVIPSSVHELIVIPKEGSDPNTLAMMIQEVNASQVNETEQLGNVPYEYKDGALYAWVE